MTVELDREKPLFEAVLPVQMTSECSGSVTDEGTRLLTVRLLLGWRGAAQVRAHASSSSNDTKIMMRPPTLSQQETIDATRGSGRERVLHMEVCDEFDAFFLYFFEVTETEFHQLRKEHALLVDFGSFPRHFIELLERVPDKTNEATGFTVALEKKQSSVHNQRGMHQVPNISNLATLAVVESNQFKKVTHLALSVRAGDDSAIKSYLAGRLEQATLLSQRQTEALRLAENEGQALENDLREHRDLLAHETQRKLAAEARAEAQHKLTIAQGQEAKQRALDALRAANTAERDIENQKHANELHEWRERAVSAERERDVLSATGTELSERLTALTKHNAKLEADAARLATACAEERALRTQMNEAKNEAEEQRHNAQVQLAAEERTAIDAKALVARADALRSAAEERESRTSTALEQAENMLAKRDEQVAKAAKEIRRGNHIIDKLSEQLRALQSKLRLKNDLFKQLERRSDDLKKSHENELHLKENALTDLDIARTSLSEVKEKLDLANAKNTDSQSIIENNRRLIQWLHSQLNSHEGLGLANIADPATAAASFEAFASSPTTVYPPNTHYQQQSSTSFSDQQNNARYYINYAAKNFETNVISPHSDKENTQPSTPPQQATPRRNNGPIEEQLDHTPRTAPPPQPSPKDPAAAYFERYGGQDDDDDDEDNDEPSLFGSQENTLADLGLGSPLVTPSRFNSDFGIHESSPTDYFAAPSHEPTAATAGYF